MRCSLRLAQVPLHQCGALSGRSVKWSWMAGGLEGQKRNALRTSVATAVTVRGSPGQASKQIHASKYEILCLGSKASGPGTRSAWTGLIVHTPANSQ